MENNQAVVDLNYLEDSKALVDMNIVMTGNEQFVELQGTGEEATFSYNQLQELLKFGQEGILKIFEIQKEALGETIVSKINKKRESIKGNV